MLQTNSRDGLTAGNRGRALEERLRAGFHYRLCASAQVANPSPREGRKAKHRGGRPGWSYNKQQLPHKEEIMIYRGVVRNGTVILEGDLTLPDGIQVKVVPGLVIEDWQVP